MKAVLYRALVVIFSVTLFGYSAGALQAATSGSHYPYGIEGVQGASPPPPGWYHRMYNVFYEADTLTDDDGDALDVGYDLEVFSSVQRFVYVADTDIFGANYSVNVIVPFENKSVKIDALGIDKSTDLSMGDIVIEPIALFYNGDRWDWFSGLAVVIPTGDFDAKDPSSSGLGYWSGIFGIGGTYYLDEERSWTISAGTRTLFHSEQDDTGVTPGAEFLVEYGLGKEFSVINGFLIRAGFAGSAYWQIMDDDKNGPNTIAEEKKKAYAVGFDVNFFYLPAKFQANIRYLEDVYARNTTEGAQIVLTLTKGF